MSHETNAGMLAARQLATIARRVGASLALDETLDAVAAAVLEVLGFRAAVVNLLAADGDLHVVAVAGDESVRRALMGTHSSLHAWQAMLDAAVPWGALRFMHHDTQRPDAAGGMDVCPRAPGAPGPRALAPARCVVRADAVGGGRAPRCPQCR